MIGLATTAADQPAPRDADDAPLVVERVRDLASLEPWVARWDALAERAEPRRPMCSGSWAAAWFEVPPRAEVRWEVALARRGDRLVGVWPMVVTRSIPRWLAPPADEHTFTGGPVVDPAEDLPTVLAALLDGGLVRRAHRVSALGLIEGDPLHRSLASLRLRGWRLMVRPARFRGARLDVASPFEARWACLTSKTRQRLKLARRRLGERGALEYPVDRGVDALNGLDAFERLEAASWKAREASAIALDQRAEKFYAAWGRRIAGRGWLEVAWATVAGRPAAAELAILFGGTLFLQKIAYSPEFARESPGHVRWAETVERCCARDDVRAIDTIGCDEIRLRWGAESYDYVHAHFVRTSLLATLTTRIPIAVRARLARWKHGDGKPPAPSDAENDEA